MLKALIFDMDGVIIDSEPIHWELIIQVLREAGGDIEPSELSKYVGTTDKEMWTDLIKQCNLAETPEYLTEKRKIYSMERFFDGQLTAIDGIPELLAQATARGLKVALATSSPRHFAEKVLIHVGIINYFDALITSDDITKSKPDPEVYQKAAIAVGVKPEECIAIEDAFLGMQAAKGAGMRCIAFTNPHSGNQDTSLADFVVSSIREINIDQF